MLPREIRQKCQKCKGSGVSDKPLLVKQGDDEVPVLAPVYTKGEQPRQQFQNCRECRGTGLTMQKPPEVIFKEGEKVQLTPEEARQRYEVSA